MKRKLLILGAGTSGTMMANHLHHHLKHPDWEITIIDEKEEHHYQPGYLFLPFDIYSPEDIIKTIEEFIPKHVKLVKHTINRILPEQNKNIYLSARNVKGVEVVTAGELSTYDIMKASTLILAESAVDVLQATFEN